MVRFLFVTMFLTSIAIADDYDYFNDRTENTVEVTPLEILLKTAQAVWLEFEQENIDIEINKPWSAEGLRQDLRLRYLANRERFRLGIDSPNRQRPAILFTVSHQRPLEHPTLLWIAQQ